ISAPQAVKDDLILVLGPYGYNKLTLGMPWQDAIASGLVRQTAPAVVSAGCLRYRVLINAAYYGPTPTVSGLAVPPSAPIETKLDVLVSVRDGVVQLIGGAVLRTPEGIGVGSSKQEFAKAYPKIELPTRGGTAAVQVSQNPMAVYVFGLSGTGTVTSFSLRLAKSDCLG
ncbi:MAG TPA: hypothetical protein VEO01_01755, partial [Pseudonocardiaceae bacterium]|nr:hypothetical protein [Pseudonocardiaceae bacterium]